MKCIVVPYPDVLPSFRYCSMQPVAEITGTCKATTVVEEGGSVLPAAGSTLLFVCLFVFFLQKRVLFSFSCVAFPVLGMLASS